MFFTTKMIRVGWNNSILFCRQFFPVNENSQLHRNIAFPQPASRPGAAAGRGPGGKTGRSILMRNVQLRAIVRLFVCASGVLRVHARPEKHPPPPRPPRFAIITYTTVFVSSFEMDGNIYLFIIVIWLILFFFCQHARSERGIEKLWIAHGAGGGVEKMVFVKYETGDKQSVFYFVLFVFGINYDSPVTLKIYRKYFTCGKFELFSENLRLEAFFIYF